MRMGMGLALVGVLCFGGIAQANEFGDATGKVGGVVKAVIVATDSVLHWSWNILHNKIVHPAVETLTLGTVTL